MQAVETLLSAVFGMTLSLAAGVFMEELIFGKVLCQFFPQPLPAPSAPTGTAKEDVCCC